LGTMILICILVCCYCYKKKNKSPKVDEQGIDLKTVKYFPKDDKQVTSNS
jgi:hypothetical protein